MKKTILILFFIIFFISSHSFSQAHVGLVGGLNFSQLSGDNPQFETQSSRKGIYGGLTWDIRIKYKTYIQVGGVYSQQGSVLKSTYFLAGEKVTHKVHNNVDYFMLPLTWKQLWGDLYTQIGVYGQTPIIAKSYWEEKIERPTTTWDTVSGPIKSFTSDLRRYDAGVFFALGFQVPISYQYDWYANVSFKQGFFPLKNHEYYNTTAYRPENIMRNRVFTISTGIIIFGKKGRNVKKRK